MARIIDGDVPLATAFISGDPWGAAALQTDREDHGGPAVIPTQWQLLRLAEDAQHAKETTTWPKGMAGVPRSVLLSWESQAAAARRRHERNAAVEKEVRLIDCERCPAGEGEQCRTATGAGRAAPHTRRREAETRVDTRLGYIGDNPGAVTRRLTWCSKRPGRRAVGRAVRAVCGYRSGAA